MNPQTPHIRRHIKTDERKKFFILGTKVFLSILICVLSYTLQARHLSAQTRAVTQLIKVSPIILHLPLSPGKTYNYEVRIDNLLDNALPINVSLEPFDTADEDGGYVFTPKDDPLHSKELISWISISDSQFILEPRGHKIVRITVRPPGTLPVGGYYALLFFTPQLPTTGQYGSLVSAKVGALMLANIGVNDPSALRPRIVEFSPTNGVFEKSPLTFEFRIANDSLNHFSAKPLVEIQTLGSPPVRIDAGEKLIFPGKTRRWELPIDYPMSLVPVHTITLQVSAGNGKLVSTKNIFIYFPLRLLFVLLLSLATIIYSSINVKKIVAAIKVLVGKD